jgi:hypothetical protein
MPFEHTAEPMRFDSDRFHFYEQRTETRPDGHHQISESVFFIVAPDGTDFATGI